MAAFEVNFDGLVGPTHHYGALAFGNLASMSHEGAVSHPKQAALQGLQKMKVLHDLGLKQAVLPPHERPYLPMLRQLGFNGSDANIITSAVKTAPELYFNCTSASSMWTANAATVSPSADCADQKVHFTPANLASQLHRSIEAGTTAKILKAIFNNPAYFCHHDPLPAGGYFADEGAANHTRFCSDYDAQGIELFVYGRDNSDSGHPVQPKKFPARQTLEASHAIGRLHNLDDNKVIFAQQNSDYIDAGVFHNDVIAVGNRNVLFYYQDAFVNTDAVITELADKVDGFLPICVPQSVFDLSTVIKSYLFNSQLVNIDHQNMALICPQECQKNASVKNYIADLIADNHNPINQVHYLDVTQSMNNGGGPACLRLRVVLNNDEFDAVNPNILFNNQLYQTLTDWVKHYYRDHLSMQDLQDPQLYQESCQALEALTQILGLGPIYEFQSL